MRLLFSHVQAASNNDFQANTKFAKRTCEIKLRAIISGTDGIPPRSSVSLKLVNIPLVPGSFKTIARLGRWLVSVLFRACFEPPPEQCRKILTGRETASESNLSNAHRRSLSQQFCRKIKPSLVQIVHGRHVGQLAYVVHKMCSLQPAICSHHFNSPRASNIVPMSDQVIQEQLNSAA